MNRGAPHWERQSARRGRTARSMGSQRICCFLIMRFDRISLTALSTKAVEIGDLSCRRRLRRRSTPRRENSLQRDDVVQGQARLNVWMRLRAAGMLHGRRIERDQRGHRRRGKGVNGGASPGRFKALAKVGSSRRCDSCIGGVGPDQMPAHSHLVSSTACRKLIGTDISATIQEIRIATVATTALSRQFCSC
jgi:hypothetical protein